MMTVAEIREYLSYDALTGQFTWLRSPTIVSKIGKLAGTITGRGYLAIQIKGNRFYAHRLAWLLVYGEWPPHEIDHIDQIKSNNRIENLRLATRQQNCCNIRLRADNTSGFKGVSWCRKRQVWLARIRINGRRKWLGAFKSAFQAHAAYIAAAKIMHGDFARAA